MKKIYLKSLLLIACLLGSITANAYDFKVDGIYYNITSESGKTVEVKSNGSTNTYSGSVTIPKTVTNGATTYSVTSIGISAFYGCDGLTSVTIPNSVTKIDGASFQNCTGLTSVTIPNSVTDIIMNAFRNCTGLTSVTIPNSVTSIGAQAFAGCTGLTKIYNYRETPQGISEKSVFYNVDLSKCTLYVPKGCVANYKAADGWKEFTKFKEMGETEEEEEPEKPATSYDFVSGGIYYHITSSTAKTVEVTYKDTYFNSYSGAVTIPASVKNGSTTYSVTAIGGHAFAECSGLTSITIPNSVTSIGYGAFNNCDYLTSFTIPKSITVIDDFAFRYTDFKEIYNYSNTPQSIGALVFDEVDISKITLYVPVASKTSYSTAAVWKDFKIKGIGETEDYFEVGGIYYHVTSSTAKTVEVTYKDTKYNSYSGAVTIPASVKNGATTYSVTSIGKYAFALCSGLTSITIPNSVTSIEEIAFSSCTGLTSITIPNSVTEIKALAFTGCTGLKEIYNYSNTPQSIGVTVFSGYVDKSAIKLYVPMGSKTSYSTAAEWKDFIIKGIGETEDYFEVGGIYYHVTSSTAKTVEVTYKDNTYNSYSGAVTIPESVKNGSTTYSVTAIGNDAFSKSTGLTKVTIPNSVKTIGNYAFYDCTGLSGVLIPKFVTSIGNYAFDGCTGVKSFSVASGNPTYYVLDGVLFAYKKTTLVAYPNAKSPTYKIPESVTNIKEGAFAGCSSLTSVTIPNSVTSIGDWVFARCEKLKEIYNCSETPQPLGTNVFKNFDPTKCILYVFYGCKNAYSNKFGWKDFIIKEIDREGYFEVDGIYYHVTSETAKTVEVVFKHTLNSYSGVVTIPASVKNAAITYSVTGIGRQAFQACTDLTNVTIPSSVIEINASAFSGCSKLTSITIPNSVTSIYPVAFSGCTGLKEIYNYSKTPQTTITEDVFSKVDKSKITLYVPTESKNSYKAAAVWKDFIIKGIGETEEETSDYFEVGGIYYHVTSSTAPLTVEVTKGAVKYSGAVTIPSLVNDGSKNYSVTAIGDQAFDECTSLTSITIPNSVTVIEDYAFSGCTGLKKFIVASGNTIYSASDDVLFNKNQTTLVAYPNAKGSTYTIPNTVTSIGEGAFSGCTGLTSITIPNSVTVIEEYAFLSCTGLIKLYDEREVPQSIKANVFEAVNKTKCMLYVPIGCTAKYKAATGWKEFNNIKEFSPTGVEVVKGYEINIIVVGNAITIKGAEETAKVEVYSINGGLIYSGFAKSITVPSHGVYIVRVAGVTKKVAL